MNLTPKQEQFCKNIAIKRMNQTDAFIDAYGKGNMKPESLWQRASQVMNNVKVLSRIEELKEKLVQKAIYTREKWAEEAEQIRCLALANEKPELHVALKAVREKAEAAALPTQKIDITSNGKDIFTNADRIAKRILGKH